jgi:hypothetical protein
MQGSGLQTCLPFVRLCASDPMSRLRVVTPYQNTSATRPWYLPQHLTNGDVMASSSALSSCEAADLRLIAFASALEESTRSLSDSARRSGRDSLVGDCIAIGGDMLPWFCWNCGCKAVSNVVSDQRRIARSGSAGNRVLADLFARLIFRRRMNQIAKPSIRARHVKGTTVPATIATLIPEA